MPDFEMPAERRALEVRASPDADASPDASVAATPATRRGWARRARGPAIGVLVGAVVASGAWWAAGSARDARELEAVSAVVDEYLDAVGSGDVARASLLAPIDDAADRQLIDAGVAPTSPPTVTCDAPRMGAALATVDCHVEALGIASTGRILVERYESGWAISSGLMASVRLAESFALVESIGGVEIPAALARGEAFFLFPGVYDVELRTPAQLPILMNEGLAVTPGSSSVRWTGSVDPQIDVDVRAAAVAFVEGCATTPLDGCPEIPSGDAPFTAEAATGTESGDGAVSFHVIVMRGDDPSSTAVDVEVRVDFGIDLDRYDVSATVWTG